MKILWIALNLALSAPLAAHEAQAMRPLIEYHHSISETASAMEVPLALVKSVRSLGMPEEMQWLILRLCKRSGKSAAEIQELRKTRHWGEVAEACGATWVGVNDEVRDIARLKQLKPRPPSLAQTMRAASNRPLSDEELGSDGSGR